jgi:ABC-type transport system involved in multi-copper enzyme maturation permease subunit
MVDSTAVALAGPESIGLRASVRNIGVLAHNTFREAIRDRVLYVFVVFSVLIMIGGRIIGAVSGGHDVKLVMDIGLSAIHFFGALIAVFIGTGLIYKEIDKRTLYTILSKRVRRWEFLVGKYMGLLATVWLTMACMFAFFAMFLLYVLVGESVRDGSDWSWARYGETAGAYVNLLLVKTFIAMALGLSVLTAVAIMFSAASTPILSAVFTVAAYIVGSLSYYLPIMGGFLREQNDAGAWDEFLATVLDVVYLALPNLHHFDLTSVAVHGKFYAQTPEWWALLGYAPAYSALALFVGAVIFERRNF